MEVDISKPTENTGVNPYLFNQEDEDLIERIEESESHAALEARLNAYKLSEMSRTIRKWVLIANIIILPIIAGIIFSLLSGSSNNKPTLSDFAAALSDEKDKQR